LLILSILDILINAKSSQHDDNKEVAMIGQQKAAAVQ